MIRHALMSGMIAASVLLFSPVAFASPIETRSSLAEAVERFENGLQSVAISLDLIVWKPEQQEKIYLVCKGIDCGEIEVVQDRRGNNPMIRIIGRSNPIRKRAELKLLKQGLLCH